MKKIIKPIRKVEQLFRFTILLTFIIVILSIIFAYTDNVVGLLFSIMGLFPLFIGFHIRQWYIITDEKIIVKNIFGIINFINKDEIEEVRIVKLSIARFDKCESYVINDNGKLKDYDLFYNKRKQPIRIPINNISTEELSKFLKR